MDTKILIIIGLTCILISLFILRKQENYVTLIDHDSLSSVIPFKDSMTAGLGYLVYSNFLINELSKNPVYWSANVFVSSLANQTGSTFTDYSSDAQIEQVFSTAYAGNEASLEEKSRLLLRQLAYYSSILLDGMLTTAITYTNDGVPDYTTTIISESGKSTREFLFNAALGSPESINNILPSRYSKYTSDDQIFTNNTDASRFEWVKKAISITPAYIIWLAKNKWNLDMTWKSSYCYSGNDFITSRIIPKPGNTMYGPGTYTLSQLGNPTSIDVYAPLTVVVNTSLGTDTFNQNESIGCRHGPEKTIDNLNNVTNIVVSLPS